MAVPRTRIERIAEEKPTGVTRAARQLVDRASVRAMLTLFLLIRLDGAPIYLRSSNVRDEHIGGRQFLL
jgi:hypothetical protein